MAVLLRSHHATSENVVMVLVASYIFTNEGNINRQIAQLTLIHAREIEKLTLEEIAQICGVSVSSYLRFCRKIGFSSYTQFRDRLSQCAAQYTYLSINSVNNQEFFDSTTFFSTVRAHLNRDLDILEDSLDTEACVRFVDAMGKAEKVFFFDIMYSTNRFPLYGDLGLSGKYIYYIPPDEIMDSQVLDKIGPDSLVFFLFEGSHRDRIMISIAEDAKKKGATIAAVSRYPEFPLKKYCDEVLYIGSTSDSISSVTTYDLVLRYLSVLYRERWLCK